MKDESNLPWYARSGFSSDVIVSSKVRVARNLANFPFANILPSDDKARVQSIIFDSFSKIQEKNPNWEFHSISTNAIDKNGIRILQERGILNSSFSKKKVQSDTGVIMGSESSFSAVINCVDHLRFSSYRNGLNFKETFKDCAFIDSKLQETLQFAASYDFGYLTSSLCDAGTGIKLSARIHIPGTVLTGKLKIITDFLSEKQILVEPAFPEISQGSVAGSFYLISTTSAMKGTELDQIADFESVCMHIAETERKILADYADNKRTVAFNSLLRAYSIAKFSMLISLREAVEIVSDLKIGLRCGFFSGIEEETLSALLYRIQPYHLEYLLNDGNFTFEKDLKNDEKGKIDRLRALLLQDAIQKISLRNL